MVLLAYVRLNLVSLSNVRFIRGLVGLQTHFLAVLALHNIGGALYAQHFSPDRIAALPRILLSL